MLFFIYVPFYFTLICKIGYHFIDTLIDNTLHNLCV